MALKQTQPVKTYQDQWLKGKLVAKGTRECANRYELIKNFCEQFKRPFTVLDIGANMSYFGIRLCEDFPECFVMAFEYSDFKMRKAHVEKNGTDRLLLLNHRLHF